MSNNKKDSFLFDSDDSDQQILPFDFMEDDDEESPVAEKIQDKEEQEESQKADSPEKETTEEAALLSTEVKSEESADKSTEELTEKRPEPISTPEEEITANQKKEPEVEEIQQEKTFPKTVKKSPSPLPKSSKKELEKKNKTASEKTSKNIKSGQILQEARVRMNLSMNQVSQNTKIKQDFIEALEKGDEANLPASVYVGAYVKKLCKLYDIDPKYALRGMTKQSSEKLVPGELLHSIEEGKQVNTEEEAKVNKFLKIAAITILAIGLTILIAVKFSSNTDKNTTPKNTNAAAPSEISEPSGQKITSADMERFIAPKRFTMTEMPIPKKATQEDGDNIL